MSTTLTRTQQGTVERARLFHTKTADQGRGRTSDPVRTDAYNLGAALSHIQLLLEVIDELTGDDEALS